jgi:hypothetical protein
VAVEFLSELDWARPWLAPWRETGEPLVAHALASQSVHKALNALREAKALDIPRFIPQAELPSGKAYEQHIFEHREVPTRDNAHDFFNGLLWLHLPQTKRRMNELQAAQIAAHGIQAKRGPVRDALTLLDENGAVLDAPPPLWDALAARDWHGLFVTLRPLWREARLYVIGHALLEQLMQPRKGLTAHVWRAPCSAHERDAWLAGQLTLKALGAKPFAPLPVLGVPGWCPANEDAAFYDDPRVFRPSRQADPATEAPMVEADPEWFPYPDADAWNP